MFSKKTTCLWDILTLYLVAVLLCTGTYYVWGITRISSLMILTAVLAVGYWRRQTSGTKTESQKIPKIQISKPVIVVLLLDAILLTTLIINRTDTLLPSPWQTLGPWFFILFALSTFFLFWSYRDAHRSPPYATILHFFLMLAVAPVIYRLGFGFDAFVHRATESWIVEHGSIYPKTPYYIGQYSFVAWLARLTQVPVFYLDVYLVPILAALTLPTIMTRTGRKPWTVWLIPFIPFLSLHVTTPHNLVVLYALLIVFTMFPAAGHQTPRYLPILLALAALATHPLLGAPLMIFVMLGNIRRRFVPILTFAGMALSVPFLFLLNNLRIGGNLPTFVNPIEQLPKFLALFARPYWYLKNAPPLFEALYTWAWLIVPAVLALAGYGFLRQKNYYLLAGAGGLFVSSWLLTSWIVFPDVVSYEQGDYPTRLLKASMIFLLPLATSALQVIYQHLDRSRYRYFIPATAAILLMLSFYFSYPQRNIKARFPGYNVTSSDFRAVEWIHNRQSAVSQKPTESDYIVLSNQLVSAAALTNYSFAKYFDSPHGPLFYYALPTGGPLYRYYGKMIYEGQRREYMEEAMALVGVRTGYFVVNAYWANSDKIIDGAKKTADSWESFGDGAVWVFVYTR